MVDVKHGCGGEGGKRRSNQVLLKKLSTEDTNIADRWTYQGGAGVKTVAKSRNRIGYEIPQQDRLGFLYESANKHEYGSSENVDIVEGEVCEVIAASPNFP